eukprot:jgi/Mesen1/10912/ME000095S10251
MATSEVVPRKLLGTQGFAVSAQGLGCMGMTWAYGEPKPEEECIAVLHRAFELGVTFYDTSDVYGPHTNELLVGKAVRSLPREKIQVATKFGNKFEGGVHSVCGTPEYVRASLTASLARLGLEYVDLYYQHRVDTSLPIEITMGEMKKLVEEGKVKYLGLSEASADTIRRAHAVHPITAVQLEWSLWSRDVEATIVPTCRELGIGIVPYSPLGRGFFSGKLDTEAIPDSDFRKTHPRFEGENLEKNKVLYERVRQLATKKGCTPGQLALAWVQHQGKDVVPIPGTTKISNLEENVGSLAVRLSDEEVQEIAAAVPEHEVAGTRYPQAMMKRNWQFADTPPLDSWKP